jgi:biotin carboxyl carrier protein
MKYIVTVGDREIELEVDGERVTVGGRLHTATLAVIPGTPLRHLMVDGRPLALAVADLGRGRWGLTVQGEHWEAEALDERARHIRSLTNGGDRPRGPGSLRAPMPGMVVRIQVEPGQSVASGAGVVVLEAMKMENELKAAGPGVVRSVLVGPGEAVEKGQVLVEFEPASA